MTGLGRGQGAAGVFAFLAEVRTVNHKYLDVRVRLPAGLPALEVRAAARVRSALSRGRVEVSVVSGPDAAPLVRARVDLALARALVEGMRELGRTLGVPGELTLSDLAAMHDTLVTPEPVADDDACWPAMEAALDAALLDLQRMRTREGEALRLDLEGRVTQLEALCARVAARAPSSVADWQARVRARVLELAGTAGMDPARLAQECALLAERADVAEELSRLRAHFSHFRSLAAGQEPAGRKLDFLCQELHRETNTLGSKSQDAEIATLVVDMKAEIERLREQVQNVE
ncbi:MAG: YicC family protein [Deltaproteobacteria bacterium]|nr:YicC family protein [Deltaproteobacteria bacterium]